MIPGGYLSGVSEPAGGGYARLSRPLPPSPVRLPGLGYPAGICARVGARFRRVYIWGIRFPRESKVNVRRASFFGLVFKVPLSFCFFGGWGEQILTWVRVGLGVCG